MKASDLLVKALENEGVEYVFGIPGEENIDFLESLRNSPIKLILTRHEQGAGFMASTYGRLTGKPGVCLSTLGPGATNFFTPAAYAQLGGMPMVMITGQKPIKKSKQGRFQIVDIVEAMTPITKFARQIVDANNIPALVRESFRLAMEERPGAVHLELPEDVAAEEGEAEIFEISSICRPSPARNSLQQAVKLIESSTSPLILIGAGCNRHGTRKEVARLIEQSGIPFFNTQMGIGVVDERHPLFIGTAALSDHDYLHCSINRADLIINIGHDVVEKPPFFMERGGAKVIHVNHFSAQVDPVYFPQLELVADIAATCGALADLLKPQQSWNLKYFLKVKEQAEKFITAKGDADDFPILPQRLVSDVRKVMPSDGILTLDNGIYKIWFARNYPAHEPNTVLLDNALATMGAGLPSAMAAKLVHPERKVLAVCGDGGFMMNSQEIETAIRLGLDLVVVVLNDSSYGMIKWKQVGLGFEEYGLDFGNPDFVKYAESYGAFGHRLKETKDFAPLLSKCLDSKGVHLIDVPVDYSENQKVLIDELKVKTCLL